MKEQAFVSIMYEGTTWSVGGVIWIMLDLCYEGTICCCCWKYRLCWFCVMKEQFVWFVGNLLKHLVVFWGWLVCWKYCCLCMLDLCYDGTICCCCWKSIDYVGFVL
jgi:hypothetical protein